MELCGVVWRAGRINDAAVHDVERFSVFPDIRGVLPRGRHNAGTKSFAFGYSSVGVPVGGTALPDAGANHTADVVLAGRSDGGLSFGCGGTGGFPEKSKGVSFCADRSCGSSAVRIPRKVKGCVLLR